MCFRSAMRRYPVANLSINKRALKLFPPSTQLFTGSSRYHLAHSSDPSTGKIHFESFTEEAPVRNSGEWHDVLPDPPDHFPGPSKRHATLCVQTRSVFASLESMIRVNHAGETAAVRIASLHLWCYPHDTVIRQILNEEQDHLAIMEKWLHALRIRPTMFDPVFHAGAFALAMGTVLLGPSAIMCAHAAIEDTITQHYNEQLRELHHLQDVWKNAASNRDDGVMPVDQQTAPPHLNTDVSESPPHDPVEEAITSLRRVVMKLRDDEAHHHDLGMQHGAEHAPMFPLLYGLIQTTCSVGIWIAKRF